MTAKKMADIFFGKFSELISRETPENKNDELIQVEGEKKTQSEKKYSYGIAAIIVVSSVIIWFYLK